MFIQNLPFTFFLPLSYFHDSGQRLHSLLLIASEKVCLELKFSFLPIRVGVGWGDM